MAHTKFTLVKTVSQLEKVQAFTDLKIYPHINESMVCGFKKCYEAQIEDEIPKKKPPKQISSANSEDVCAYL